MSSIKKEQKGITRREFVKGAVVGTAAVAGAGALAGCGPAAPAPASDMPKKWDKEADVVVVGYGYAGAATAITAHDKGSKVLMLEKQPEDGHFANSKQCGGVFVSPANAADAVAYMGIASRVNVDMPESKDIDDDIIQAWSEYATQNKDWLTDLGIEDFVVYADHGRDPSWPGNDAIKAYQVKMPDGSPGRGLHLFNFLAEHVTSREVEVMWETPATRLITNEKGEVIGVKAQSKDGEIAIKAAKAVVLTCGGFEFDEAAKKAYFPAYPMAVDGNPGNTGDGIRMALEVGADLWHMTVIGGHFKMKAPDFPIPFRHDFNLKIGPTIALDKFGRRFKAENQLGGYSGYWNALVYDTVNYTWPRIPVHWIFDEKRRTAGRLARGSGATGPIEIYKWSEDNSEEIEKGWITKADTIKELAQKINVDPTVLEEEVSKYNGYCQAGYDADFERDPETLIPLDSPPYYAAVLYPGPNNTFGGPRRNAKAQIVSAFGEPIPRLYSAGELGSIFVQYPQGGANVSECFAFGRIAGENADTEEPWG